MNTLIVYLNIERVGNLGQDDSGLLQFSYDQAWLEKPSAIPLSRSLPLQSEVFTGKEARPFFAGILPEEEPRKQIAKILGISDTNDFAMLARIGGECAGAVSLLP
ncbi:MAG: HipA N-terminal domain-containing protein, partial [Candidatus Aureabacteria bacterium]|nr:HipA N-terminal domain-containing protein [Candidatus Auribacterota bacterium]